MNAVREQVNLSSNNLQTNTIPYAWKAILDKTDEFYRLVFNDSGSSSNDMTDRQKRELVQLHDLMLEESASLLEQQSLDDFSDDQLRFLTLRSLTYLAKLEESVGMSFNTIDTYGTETLFKYNPDLPSCRTSKIELEKIIQEKFQPTASELASLRDQVSRFEFEVHNQTKVILGVCEEFELDQGAEGMDDRVYNLFSSLYPDSGFRSGDVDVIVTGTNIFFCLKFDEISKKIETDWFDGSGKEDVKKAEKFIAKLTKFKQEQFAHFPVFGFFNGRSIEEGLLNRLSQRSNLSMATIAEVLTTAVTILPHKDVEKYIVHDVWGHGWQSGLLCFGDMYKEISLYNKPLLLREEAKCPRQGKLKFGDAFKIKNSRVEFDAAKFRAFVDAEISERIPAAMTPVLAELMADVVEYRVIEEQPILSKVMPNSSLFKSMPAKLDLTLKDLRFYFLQATKVFRLWASADNSGKTIAELVSLGGSKESAEEAVVQAMDEWRRLENQFYSAEIKYKEDDSQIYTNAFTRLVLNFVGLHRQLVLCYRQISDLKPQFLNLNSFKDLLILATSVFFEMDRRRNIWRLDEFLGLKFVPMCRMIGVIE